MKIIISPAKKMKQDADSFDCHELPQLLHQTEQLYQQLCRMSYTELKRLWCCNDQIATLNYERLQKMDLHRNLTPAIMSYEGIQYRYMAPSVLTDKELAYLEQNLHAHGYDCILGCSGFKQEEKEDYVRLLLSKKIDTLILVGSTYAGNGKDESDTDYIREAAEQVSIFMINAKVSGDNIYCTYADDFQATYEVTKAFIRRGKEKILFMYDSESYSARQKKAGYEAALQDA